MKDTISFTIPMERSALTRTANMLQEMANDLPEYSYVVVGNRKSSDNTVESKSIHDIPEGAVAVAGDINESDEVEPSATTVFGESPELAGAPDVLAGVGVELDKAGLPWDHRIHGAARKKLVKEGTWKYIRGIDPALIQTVEAELRAAMAASPSNPVIIDDVKEKQAETILEQTGVVVPAKPPIVETEVTPAPPATDITFPMLMGRITAGKITETVVIAACNKHGIPALPLLAARPDLIPAVAAELGITA